MYKPMRTLLGGVIASSMLALAACSGGTAQTGGGSSSGGDLTIARAADAISMDNTTTFDNNSIFVQEQIMEPLFTVTDDGQKVKPWLASGYKLSSDGLTYTVSLRQGVKFSNGTPMTAKDVKFSIDADSKTADTGWGYINAAIKDVKVINDSTVEFDLKYKWAPFLADLALFSNGIVPDNYGGKTKAEFYQAPVGTGPFKWDKWQKGQSLKLVKNTNYWQKGKPTLDSVTWTVVPDSNTRKLQLQGGQIDIDDTPDWSSFNALQSASGLKAVTFPSTYEEYIAFNQKRAPFNDVHVRRAISYAIDRKSIIKTVLFGHGTEANSLLSPGTPYYDKSAQAQQYDTAKAKAELAESSRPDGFSTTILVASGDANQQSIAQIMQSELAKLNIKLTIKSLDPTANKQARNQKDFDMTVTAWTMDIPDPDEWTSFAVDPNGGSSSAYTSYNNPQVVALNKQAQQTSDTAERQKLYSELQQKTGQDAFLAYLYYAPYAYAISNKVSGFMVTPLGNYNLEDVKKAG